MAMKPIPLFRPSLGAAEVNAVRDVLRSGWVVYGPKNEELEQAISRMLGVRHCITVNSGASALYLALKALGVTGEVIIPSFTMSATAHAVVTAGARPVFAEVDLRTGNLDPRRIVERITRRTEAIMPVHFAGQPCDMGAIMRIARKRGLTVIEDSAECLGGKWQGRLAGTFGDAGCFSFWASKNITTGEGGAVVTNDSKLAQIVRSLASHGIMTSTRERERFTRPWQRDAIAAGHNLRMSNIAAAIGVEQTKKLVSFNRLRRARAAELRRLITGVANIEPLHTLPKAYHVYQMFVVRVPAKIRDAFVLRLRERGVLASVHFDPPVHRQTFYRKQHGRISLPATDALAGEVITLPLFPAMSRQDVRTVARRVREVARELI